MRLHAFKTFRPNTLKEALSLKSRYKKNAVLKAGGTSLIPEMRLGLKNPQYVILLDHVREISGIEEKPDGLHVGAAASLQDIKTSATVKEHYGPLAEAIENVSAPSLHYQSTIGGNICQDTRCIYYDQSEFWRSIKGACFKQGGDKCNAVPASKICRSVYQGDLAPVLICMDASVRISSPKKDKLIKIADLFSGNGLSPLKLPPNSILTEIILPRLETRKVAYVKQSERGALDYPVVGVAAFVKLRRGLVEENGFAVTAIGPAPLVVTEPLLNARRLDEGFISYAAEVVAKKAKPIANMSATPAYRKYLVKILVGKVLRRLA